MDSLVAIVTGGASGIGAAIARRLHEEGAQGDIAANVDDEWARVLSINVTGIARVTSAALTWLRPSLHSWPILASECDPCWGSHSDADILPGPFCDVTD